MMHSRRHAPGMHGSGLFDHLQILGCEAAAAIPLVREAQALAFVEAAQTGFLHGGDVYENVLRPVIGLNEPEPLVASNHFTVPLVCMIAPSLV